MNLDFSDDQKFLQDEARKFFDKEGGLANARKVMAKEGVNTIIAAGCGAVKDKSRKQTKLT